MEQIELTVQKRSESGKGVARKLRQRGLTPAVLYGAKREPTRLSLNPKEIVHILHTAGENVIINLAIENEKDKRSVIIREFQTHPVKGNLLHVDFFEISMSEKIDVEVPILLIGEPVGVTLKGGILQHAMHQIKVECLPSEIPEHIEVDVSSLDIGYSLHVKDIKIDEKIKIVENMERVVANVIHPVVEKKVEEEEEEKEVKEPEVIGKGKEETEE